MSEQINNEITTPAAEENKTFSQADVNRIVQERLAKERSKGDASLAQREQELAKRELQLTAKEKLSAKSLPLELLDALNVSTPEALEKSLAIIENLNISPARKSGEVLPAIKVSTGGEHTENITRNADKDSIRAAMGLQHKKE